MLVSYQQTHLDDQQDRRGREAVNRRQHRLGAGAGKHVAADGGRQHAGADEACVALQVYMLSGLQQLVHPQRCRQGPKPGSALIVHMSWWWVSALTRVRGLLPTAAARLASAHSCAKYLLKAKRRLVLQHKSALTRMGGFVAAAAARDQRDL